MLCNEYAVLLGGCDWSMGGLMDDGSRIWVFNVKHLLETDRASLILRRYTLVVDSSD